MRIRDWSSDVCSSDLDARERVRWPREQGPPDRRHRHRQHLGGVPPPPRRGRRPSDRGRKGGPGPRHRPRLGLRRAHPGALPLLSGPLPRPPPSCSLLSSRFCLFSSPVFSSTLLTHLAAALILPSSPFSSPTPH